MIRFDSLKENEIPLHSPLSKVFVCVCIYIYVLFSLRTMKIVRSKNETKNMPERKKMKVKKGWLAIEVGLQEEDGRLERFEVPISYLYHPLFKNLLDKAQEIYGYHANGPLRLPCSVDDFLQLRWRIERESSDQHHNNNKQNHNHHHRQHHHHYHLPLALSFQSC